jgi:hypothetical protein
MLNAIRAWIGRRSLLGSPRSSWNWGRIAGRAFELDDRVQDATFFADLSVQRPGPKPNWIDTVFAVRFSYFGMLCTTWSHCETERLPDEVVEELLAAVSRAGFKYVPAEPLAAPYTGRNPAFAGSSWWIRFFDYCPECMVREKATPKRLRVAAEPNAEASVSSRTLQAAAAA